MGVMQAPSVIISPTHPDTLVKSRSWVPPLLNLSRDESDRTLGTRLHTRLVFKETKL